VFIRGSLTTTRTRTRARASADRAFCHRRLGSRRCHDRFRSGVTSSSRRRSGLRLLSSGYGSMRVGPRGTIRSLAKVRQVEPSHEPPGVRPSRSRRAAALVVAGRKER